MSAARGRDRRGLPGRGHLVLVRGGVDHDGQGPDDADWQAFCERIGWQHVEPELPDDYEDRLAARIFENEGGLEDPVSAGVARALREARISAIRRMVDELDDGGPISGTAPSPRSAAPAHHASGGSAPRAFMAAAPLAVAAALFVVATAVLWRAARPSPGAVACPDSESAPRANIAPVSDRVEPMEPTDRRPDPSPRARPLRTRDAPTRTAPSETKPQKPITPGSRIALRERRDDVRPRASRSGMMGGDVPMLPGGSLVRTPMASAASLPIARPDGIAVAPALPVLPRTWPAEDASSAATSRVSEGWTRPASFTQEAVPASATWSLSPGNPRWYGVGLPPSTAPIGVPSGVGVMAQLDLGKAIDAR